MATLVFDTYQVIQRLQSRGFEPEQAKALTDELKSLASSKQEGLATKEDIAELDLKITRLEGDMKTLMWMLGFTLMMVSGTFLKLILG